MILPSLHNMIFLIIFITVIGVIIDLFIQKDNFSDWRQGFVELWKKLITGSNDLLHDANRLFCELFDKIYGSQSFSRQRIYASVLSSTIALVGISLILGVENTYFNIMFKHAQSIYKINKTIDWNWLFRAMLYPIVLNIIFDYFSLLETRKLLEFSKNKGAVAVFGLIILDLLFTIFIFIIGFLFLYAINAFLFTSKFSYDEFKELLPYIFKLDAGLVFFLTTFVTSFIWIIALTIYLIWPLHKLTPVTDAICYHIGKSKQPASTFSAFLNILIITIFVAWSLTGFIMNSLFC